MQMPAVQDTIVAVSSAWQPAPVGIIRLSGADAFALLARVTAEPLRPVAYQAVCTDERLRVCNGCELPATIFSFRAPRSYTGQDVVEIHTVGCLPLLRELSAHLIELGARRALPGEFTARAFLNGKLDARQVEAVLALMQAEHEAGLRQAARVSRSSDEHLIAAVRERIIALLALIEAGIDFVEDDDVHFISGEEVARTLDESFVDLAAAGVGQAGEFRGHKPHVALVGLPNAGKSTLFNALIGSERALVSPVLGTTRDVLSAELEIEGVSIVVQDCAGLGEGADELELATHVATERAAQQADVVLWVHAANTGWDEREAAPCRRIPPERRVLVQSKMDLASERESDTEPQSPPIAFAATVAVSATQAFGIGELRAVIAERVDSLSARVTGGPWRTDLGAAEAALRRAQALARTTVSELVSPELVALELRAAVTLLTRTAHGPLDEELLERIFSQFCVGK